MKIKSMRKCGSAEARFSNFPKDSKKKRHLGYCLMVYVEAPFNDWLDWMLCR